jgi:hypothetical protein
VANGLVPPANTVSFMMASHSKTGSAGVIAANSGETPNNAPSNRIRLKILFVVLFSILFTAFLMGISLLGAV